MKRVYTFTDSQFLTASEKQQVIRAWERFLKSGFEEKNFTKALYQHLINHCEFIAHFNQQGFYGSYFTNPKQTIKFLRQFDRRFGCVSVEYDMDWRLSQYADLNEAMCDIVDEYKEALYPVLESKHLDYRVSLVNERLQDFGFLLERNDCGEYEVIKTADQTQKVA